MKYALVNPNWSFEGSTYFGCRDPHLPLELLYAEARLRAAGHEALVIDAQMEARDLVSVRAQLQTFDPDFLVIPTAPSYLFWRCPPPELRVPAEWFHALRSRATQVAIGPHGSATPAAVLRKTGCDVVIRGEADFELAKLADSSSKWDRIPGCCFRRPDGSLHLAADLAATPMHQLPALDFARYPVELHAHRHHVFHGSGRGAELEFSRGCPWSCIFCNKTLFRDKYREREADAVLAEVDALLARGVDYFYFIDEIFGVGKNVRRLLEGLAQRRLTMGCQTRIDLWNEDSLELLGRAGCISMECGIESITEEGRDALRKNCRISTDRISELLRFARGRIPWVQANLILAADDDRESIQQWQQSLKAAGVWVSEPVPMFPYPGTPLYLQTFGAPPDDNAWERAHHHYLSLFPPGSFSDIQSPRPLPIETLEAAVS